MALPVVLIPVILTVTFKGADSVGNGINNLKLASSISRELQTKYKLNIEYFENKKSEVTSYLDELGKKELEIFETFEKFSLIMEQIQNRPVFKKYSKGNFIIPEYNPEEIKEVSLAATLVLGGLSGASIGIAGGIAAGGATTTLVSALGVASTGTAISSLSGVAATNAIYAALGGGAVAAGGGGVAAGAVVLGGATLGIGILAGGFFFEKYTESIKEKVEEMLTEVEKTAKEISKICHHLSNLKEVAIKFNGALVLTNRIYREHLSKLETLVFRDRKRDWNYFTEEEKKLTENTILLVGLLYNLGKTKLLLAPKDENELEEVNEYKVNEVVGDTKRALIETGLKKSN